MFNKEIKYFDIHSHLHSGFFEEKENIKIIIEKMLDRKIWTISIGVNFEDSKKSSELAEKNKNIFCSIGIHPEYSDKENWDEVKFQKLFDKNKKVVCIGECGLDYFWLNKDLKSQKINQEDFLNKIKKQKEIFEKQIDFSVKNNIPLMLHIRSFENADAYYDAFEILDKKQIEHKGKIKADFHFFTEGPKVVKEIVERNFMISIPGVVTFANLDDSIKEIPLENLMVETDSPYAAPVPYRGKVNNPLYLSEIIKKIADIKNISEESLRKKTVDNALEFFKIK